MRKRSSEHINKKIDRAMEFVLEDCPVALGILFIAYMNVMTFGSGTMFKENQLPWSLCMGGVLISVDAGLLWLGKNKLQQYLSRKNRQRTQELFVSENRPTFGHFVVAVGDLLCPLTANEPHTIQLEHMAAGSPSSLTFILDPHNEDHAEIIVATPDSSVRLDWGYYLHSPDKTQPRVSSSQKSKLFSDLNLEFSDDKRSLFLVKAGQQPILLAQLVSD